MQLPRGVNALLAVLLLLLVAALGVMAVLQYRWIDRLSDAERQRMQSHLDYSGRRFADDLRGQLEEVFEAFAPADGGELGDRYDTWARSAPSPALISAVRAVERVDGGWVTRLLDRETLEVVDTPWPAHLEPLHRHLQQQQPGRRIQWPPPFVAPLAALFIGPRRGPPPEMMMFDGPPPLPRPVGTLVELDRATLANSVLPSLAKRHFAADADTYTIAVLYKDQILYRSHASWPDGRTRPDFELEFVPADPSARRDPRRPEFAPPSRMERPIETWRLVVRRENGGLDMLVAAARRRNLAISFGILFLLAATALLLVALVRRADRLRKQQAHFVAAISHELNTPIAALRAAGENLKDGIVADPEKLARYGATIVKESSRLGEMVAQVLEFAGMQARPLRPRDETVDVAEVVAEAVAQCQWLVNGTAIDVETHVAPDLPPVRGDAQALTRAVQNLVANAIRHGGVGKWVGLHAARSGNGGVAITVEDHGPGIAGGDLSHLFEPFYRGRESSRVRGTGLGLAIVREIARAHGGSVQVDARRRDGAAFTLHLPTGAERA